MKKLNIDVEIKLYTDKNVYMAPDFIWDKTLKKDKCFETFFYDHFVRYLDEDYIIIKREAERNPEKIEYYKGRLKVLENIVSDIRNSITYKILEENNGVEYAQVNFSFNYYEQKSNPEELFKLLFITDGIMKTERAIRILIPRLLDEVESRYRQDVNNPEYVKTIEKVKSYERKLIYLINLFKTLTYQVSYHQEKRKNK